MKANGVRAEQYSGHMGATDHLQGDVVIKAMRGHVVGAGLLTGSIVRDAAVQKAVAAQDIARRSH